MTISSWFCTNNAMVSYAAFTQRIIFVNKDRKGSFTPAGIESVTTLVGLPGVDLRVGVTKEVRRDVWRTRSIVTTNNKNK